jgi:hypothetical protein
MTKNMGLSGEELETMSTLHVRFANYHKIKRLGLKQNLITIEELIQNDHYGFKSGLNTIMDSISTQVSSQFQIEFIFNIDFENKETESGFFHIVQLTLLPALNLEFIEIPKETKHEYLSVSNLQGHGIIAGLKSVVVVSPFLYSKDKHDEVRQSISENNRKMKSLGKKYILIVPGRLGSTNRDWGIQVNYGDVDAAAAIFEYGVDIAGRVEPLPEEESLSGGIYGSHFLYMIQGGHDEDERKLQTRIYGTQGTHFLTNLVSNNVIYGYIVPTEDKIDPWFFNPSDKSDAVFVLEFPQSVTIYADSISQHCVAVV